MGLIESNNKCGLSDMDIQIQIMDECVNKIQTFFKDYTMDVVREVVLFEYLCETVIIHSATNGGPIKSWNMSMIAVWAYLTSKNTEGFEDMFPELHTRWHSFMTLDENHAPSGVMARIMNNSDMVTTKSVMVLCPFLFWDLNKRHVKFNATVTAVVKKYSMAENPALFLYPHVFLKHDQDLGTRSPVETGLIGTMFKFPTTYSFAAPHEELSRFKIKYNNMDTFGDFDQSMYTDTFKFLFLL